MKLHTSCSILSILIFLIGGVACQSGSPSAEVKGEMDMQIIISSSIFSEGGDIPLEYTCDGDDLSPPLAWSGVPVEAQSLVLIVDDPDAPIGTFVHWVLYDLPSDTKSLPEGVEGVGTEGLNDFRDLGYKGPCPPKGPAHRYFFKIYALDEPINLKPGATKSEVEEAMQGHILAEGQLIGKYRR